MTGTVVRLEAQLTDSELVLRARSGDMGAKEMLFRRHVAMASGLAFRLLGRDADIEDVVQDSFVVAFTSLDKLERLQAFASWLASIVTGTAISLIRRRRLLSRLGFVRVDPVLVENIVSADAPADVTAELRAVYRIVDRLPAEERVVLVLRRVEQLALDEIAEQTGWSLATVKRKLARADERLAEAVSEEDARARAVEEDR